ncbi:MAG TPA: group I intron-associated PD-(D/E)XK endonuclease [Terriglobales bacterium]|nr:group I intron-associated PD-(D/E)XK endonuclease [Terriglobales bacterium]
MSPLIKHPKRRGEWVELQFMARAASHGLTVSQPWGDSARYDFVVEHRARFSRVQVKSTSFCSGGAYVCNTISRPPGRTDNGTGYTAEEIDFFAFFVIPEDVWYIAPVTALRRTRYAAYLNPHDRRNKYFRYMEAWHLLKKGPDDRRTSG